MPPHNSDSPPFEVGDTVRVVSLRKDGTIQRILNQGRYSVLVGNLQLKIAHKDLTPAKAQKIPTAQAKRKQPKLPRRGERRVDLHGMTVPQAESALADVINRAILDNLHKVEVVHGIGSGRVRDAVVRFVASLKGVAEAKQDERNAGVTWVYLG